MYKAVSAERALGDDRVGGPRGHAARRDEDQAHAVRRPGRLTGAIRNVGDGYNRQPFDIAHVDLRYARSIRDERDLAGQRTLQSGARRLRPGR